MAGRSSYPEAQIQEILARLAKGETLTEISRETGIPRGTIEHWRDRRVVQQQPPEAVSTMEAAALREQNRRLQEEINILKFQPRPAVTSQWQETLSVADKWLAAERDNEERITKSLTAHRFTADLEGDKPIALVFISDQHIAGGNTIDLKRMRQDAELIAQTDGAYAICGGDFVDNHIKHRAAALAARSQPSDQYQFCAYYLSIFAHRILVMISGNHDDWSDQIAGVDVLHMLAGQQKICYAKDEARLEVRLGNQKYRVAVRHQYRYNSSFNQTHAVKQWFRMGEEPFDIGCICHHHEAAIESFVGHGQKRWACRPGSYQITSAYSRQYGFNPTQPACPTFLLYPGSYKAIGFDDCVDGLRFLAHERGAC